MLMMVPRRTSLAILLPALMACTYGCATKTASDGASNAGTDAGVGGSAGSGGANASAGSGAGEHGDVTAGAAGASEGGAATSGSGGSPGAGEAGHSGVTSGGGGPSAGAGGAAGESSADDCSAVDNPGQTDTDGDGVTDACDEDDDDDGFRDGDDPAPLDPSIPGDFSTPEAILANPLVKTALKGAADANAAVATHTERTPPDVSGYYVTADGGGEFVATGDGTDIGRLLAGSENRLTSGKDDTIDSAWVGFTSGSPYGYGTSLGELLRGTSNEITVYSRGKAICTEGGAHYSYWTVTIGSATIDSSGNWTDQRSILVNVLTDGTLNAACANRIGGNAEVTGGWSAVTTPLTKKVKTTSSLQYMCVDGSSAYIPEETWRESGGNACECGTDYTVSCH